MNQMTQRAMAIACAAVVGAAAWVGTGTAAAAPACPDIHVIGAAGSGERTDADLTQYAGMGRVVYQSLRELAARAQRDGRTLTAEAVDYPATEAPGADGGIGQWLGFMGSVDTGTAAMDQQYQAFVAQCPTTKVVLAGYSQGAMVMHRNLAKLSDSPNLAAVLLVADGDRRVDDATLNLGTVDAVPGRGKGVAQDWPILAHAPAPLPPAVAARTISVCDLNDAVCDYREDADDSAQAYAQRVAVHTSYARSAELRWSAPLYALVASAALNAQTS